MNLCGVDRGALKMALNVLERAGKDEVKSELADSVLTLDELLQATAKDNPAMYMQYVTNQMMIDYT